MPLIPIFLQSLGASFRLGSGPDIFQPSGLGYLADLNTPGLSVLSIPQGNKSDINDIDLIRHGDIIVKTDGGRVPENYKRNPDHVISTPVYTAISGLYINRFKDPRHYSGDVNLER